MDRLISKMEEKILSTGSMPATPRMNYEENDPFYKLKHKSVARQKEFSDLDLNINVKCKMKILKETEYAGEKTREMTIEYDIFDLEAKIQREVRKHFLELFETNNLSTRVLDNVKGNIMIKFPISFSD